MANENRAAYKIVKELHSWEGFSQFFDNEFDVCEQTNSRPLLKDYVWRGHRLEEWKLESLFDRAIKESRNNKKRKEILKEHLNSFVYACRGKLENFGLTIRELKALLGKSEEEFEKYLKKYSDELNSDVSYGIVKVLGSWINKGVLNENHIWALGQHYGLATPLLDWCYSPYVAAFFAFEKRNEDAKKGDGKNEREKKKHEENEHRVIFGLKIQAIKRFGETELEYFDPMSSEHPRLVNQRGVFSKARNGTDIEELLKKYEHRLRNERNLADKDPWLIRIEVKDTPKNRQEFLHRLNAMNINHMSVYPELQGSAQFCNLGIEFDGYARFHGQGTS